MAFGTLGRVDRARILATASRQTVRSAGKTPWQRFVVGCVAVVLSMILFPQEIAALIADHLGRAWKQ
jgi:hypothetical protein